MKKTIFATLVVLCSAASPAATAIIDFEPLKHEDTFNTNFRSTIYTEDGFLITLILGNNLTTFGTLGERFSGSTALFNNTTNGVTKLTREDGGSFDLNAIDIAELDGDFEVSVTFGGILSGGGSVTQLFTLALDGISFGPQNFSFSPAFESLAEVTWVQSFPFHQIDNINAVASSIPEPSTLALVATGLALLAFLGWRRRRSVQVKAA